MVGNYQEVSERVECLYWLRPLPPLPIFFFGLSVLLHHFFWVCVYLFNSAAARLSKISSPDSARADDEWVVM